MMSSAMTNCYQLNNYTAISVEGADASKFLQGQTSCDLDLPNDYWDSLFCDEKGYVITNASIRRLDEDRGFLIIVRNDVCDILIGELKKFSKFFDCSIKQQKYNICGTKKKNSRLIKVIDSTDANLSSEDWDEICVLNFCFDVNAEMSGKFRINELGYDLNLYVSYDKGCYRGQEIIARLTYLGKKTKKVVVFDSDFKEITNSDNRPIGKKVFSLHLKDKEYSQFFVENTDYYSQEEKIIPVTSQWDLDLD